jgi:hypothetical protein
MIRTTGFSARREVTVGRLGAGVVGALETRREVRRTTSVLGDDFPRSISGVLIDAT